MRILIKQFSQIFIIIILMVGFIACSRGREEYGKKFWQHKQRMLDVAYEKELIELKKSAELELTIRRVDSIMYYRALNEPYDSKTIE